MFKFGTVLAVRMEIQLLPSQSVLCLCAEVLLGWRLRVWTDE